MTKISNYDLEGVEKYLRENFKKAPVSWLGKILGESTEYLYSIINTEEYECNKYFSKIKLILVTVDAPYLDMPHLPSSRTSGVFAINENLCLNLSHSKPENFSKVLEQEGNIKNIPALELAKLSCDALLSNRGKRHQVLNSFRDIELIASNKEGYIIDQQQAKIINNILSSPKLVENNGEYSLKFFTLYGWMHDCRIVNAFYFKISREFSISYSNEVISEKIFSTTPFII